MVAFITVVGRHLCGTDPLRQAERGKEKFPEREIGANQLRAAH